MEDRMAPNRSTMISLLARTKDGDKRARSEMVERSIGLVRKIASHYHPPPRIDRDELVQEGALALQQVVDRWDPTLGEFGTFAGYWIRMAMSRHLRHESSMVDTGAESRGELDRRMAEEPCCDRDHKRRDDARVATSAMRGVDSLDAPINDGSALIESLSADCESPEDQADMLRAHRSLHAAISTALTERERSVMRRRLLGATLNVIAAEMGTSKQRTQQIESRAIARLRDSMCGESHAL
jgi:RNA polymerase sigma factor (sigma-70 family)